MLDEERYHYQKDYAKSEEGRKSFQQARARWRRNNRIKEAAAGKVRTAVYRGRLVKPERCQGCKTQARLHGHHDNYAYPMEVKWLCDVCHRGWHRVFGEAINKRKRRRK